MSIKAKCKHCGKDAPAEQFMLHYQLKMMVCPDCFRGKTQKEQQKQQIIKKEADHKPPGWDKEDEYLDKYSRMKEKKVTIKFTRIPGTNQIKCLCNECKFEFKYDPFRKRPKNCPYCNHEIPRLNTFNLL